MSKFIVFVVAAFFFGSAHPGTASSLTIPGFADITSASWIWGPVVVPTGSLGFRRVYTTPKGKFATVANCQAGTTRLTRMAFYINGRGGITSFPILNLPLNGFSNLFAIVGTVSTSVDPPAGFIAACQMVFSDGTIDTLVTAADGTWHTAPISGKCDLAFTMPGYFENRTWVGATLVGPFESQPISVRPMPPPVTFAASSWIWTNEGTSLPGQARAFRYTFSPPAGEIPLYATVLVTCDNSYTFWLNGNLIAVSPTTTDWTVAQRYVLQLMPGLNVFAFAGFNWDVDPSPAGLLVSAQVELASGALVNFVTDGTWRTLNAQAPPVNFQASTFNDINWNSATSYGIYGGGSWGSGVAIPSLLP
ncbi:hypothetical protein C8J57DRAFT_1477650 [Mycena rebaudengoi]|nr:hypothetical protein C8J57DRAFT_1477650 [Mycena rebaudengoi]